MSHLWVCKVCGDTTPGHYPCCWGCGRQNPISEMKEHAKRVGLMNMGPLEMKEPEWDGAGLPPVGTDCEYRVGQESYQVIVIAHAFDEVVVYQKDASPDYTGVQPAYLFPIRTQAQREREEAIDCASKAIEMAHGSAGSAYKKYCQTLYDAGMLRRGGE